MEGVVAVTAATRARPALCSSCSHPVADHRCGHLVPCCPGTCDLNPRGQRTRAIIAAEKLTLSRAERHDLAELLVGHAGSWHTLSEPDARRVADALDAFLAVQALLMLRAQGRRR